MSMIFMGVVLVIFVIAAVNAMSHCDPGYGGYPDRWDDPKWEKLNDTLGVCALICMILSVASALLEV